MNVGNRCQKYDQVLDVDDIVITQEFPKLAVEFGKVRAFDSKITHRSEKVAHSLESQFVCSDVQHVELLVQLLLQFLPHDSVGRCVGLLSLQASSQWSYTSHCIFLMKSS